MTSREDEIYWRDFQKHAKKHAFIHDLALNLKHEPTLKQKIAKEWVVQNKSKVENFAAAVVRYPNLLTEQMLAARWHCSSSRLQNWRSHQKGPPYVKFGGRVLYRIDDILEFEKEHIQNRGN